MSVVFGREGREARFGIIRLQVVTPLLRSTTVDTGQNNKSFISKLHKTGLGCLCVVRHLHFQQFEHTWSVRKCAISERWDQQPIFTLFSLDIRPHFCLQTAVSQWQPYNHRIGCIHRVHITYIIVCPVEIRWNQLLKLRATGVFLTKIGGM